jgi:hypothetical protein
MVTYWPRSSVLAKSTKRSLPSARAASLGHGAFPMLILWANTLMT